tara:strand:+ start:104 stop:340 length:237 start_codon:yes stop_codon:yes gene_type:complete
MNDSQDKVGVNVRCWKCEQVTTIKAALADIQQWQDGTLVQDAMPYLDADERELLISRTCSPCFDKMFGEGDAGWDNWD